MNQLEELGIEFKPLSRYNAKCPRCGDDRRKKNTRSLSVFIELPYIRFQCHHFGCEWHSDKQQFIKVVDGELSTVVVKEVNREYQPIKDGEYPFTDKDTMFHPYYYNGQIWFYIVRRGNGESKWIRPFAKTKEGDWVMERPKEKVLYRSEKLSQSNPVIVVEGEKAADIAAAKLGEKVDIITWPGGAANINQGDWDLLKNRKVILWPDNDAPGNDAMQQIAPAINTQTLYMVDVSSLPPKADLGDDIPIDTIRRLYQNALKKNIARPLVRGVVKQELLTDAFKEIPEGLPIGWQSVDKYIRLPARGITVIQGRTNHGKSAAMINVMANLLAQTEAVVVYLSYEMSYKEILLRLTKTIDGTAYSNIGYEDDKIYYQMIREGKSEAFKKISDYIVNRRLLITDEIIDVEEVTEMMQRMKTSLGKPGVVFLDYLQLVPAKNGRKDQRYLEVKNVAEKLRHAANTNDMAVVEGSQSTNGETPFADVARESKDIEFTASLILKIWNKLSARVTGAYKTKRVDGEEVEVPYYDHVRGDFVIEVRKTRQGEVGRCFGFNWSNGCKLVPAENTISEF